MKINQQIVTYNPKPVIKKLMKLLAAELRGINSS